MRAAIFDWDKVKEEDKKDNLVKYLHELAFDRAGFLGAFSPLYNAFRGIKYERDLTSIMAGAQVGFFLTGIERMIKPYVGRNSEGTNTAEHQQAVAFASTVLAPLLTYTMTSVPGGPLMATLIMGGTSGTAAGWFADKVRGEKYTVKSKREKAERDAAKLFPSSKSIWKQ